MPQSCPVGLNASGGTPTDTSRRNCCWRAQTSALSPSTMNGRSPNSATPCVRRRACCHCVPASHRRQPGLAAERLELEHVRNADEDRIDRHRADRRVRRLLARRHFVERQELQHVLAGGRKPGGERLDIADVADAPARRGRTREQRDEQPRPTAAGRSTHGRLARHAKWRSTRTMPSANDGAGGSRLTTRNDSRGKSKKYPGCVRTPSAVSSRTTRSSSDSRAGTCRTAYHPPPLRSTSHDGTPATADRSHR